MKQKLKQKKYKKFFDVCKETAKLINGAYREMTNKMWEIGKIIAEKREEVNPKYGSGFLAGIANEMKENVSIVHLGNCERFYSRFPDLLHRCNKSGLSPTHYIALAKRDLTNDEINKYENLASEKEWSVRELENQLPTKRVEILKAEAIEAYEQFVTSLTKLEAGFERLKKSKVKGVLSQNQINGIARSLWVFLRVQLPKIIDFLDRHDAKLDPIFKKYVRKFK